MVTLHFIKYFSIAVLVTFLVSSVNSKGDGCPPSSKSLSKNSSEKREKYIVMLKSSKNQTSETHFKVMSDCWNRRVEHVSPNVNGVTSLQDRSILRDFSVDGDMRGYSGWFTPSFVKEELSKMDDVLMIEKDAPVQANYVIPQNLYKRTIAKNPTPNIDRIDQAKFPLNREFEFPDSAGEGVNIFVIDTGIRVTHSEFGKRAKHGGSFCEGCNDDDENGHGTHVASIAAGKTLGVARKANLIAVRVLDAQGKGSNTGVIDGMSFVLEQHKKSKNKNSIVNMSLGGVLSEAVNTAVQSLTDAGVHVVVAAGNDGADACTQSPASAKTAITVGATENTDDNVTDFSNIGKCVDIFAPGRNIMGAGILSDGDMEVFSGTSQACPHVAGTVALIISKEGNKSPAQMAKELDKLSTKNVVKSLDKNTKNRFVRVPAS